MNPRLEDWAVVEEPCNPCTPPELRPKALVGRAFGHPNFEDGEMVHTTMIVEHDYANRRVTTKSRTYELGRIEQAYFDYMKEHNIVPKTFSPEAFL